MADTGRPYRDLVAGRQAGTKVHKDIDQLSKGHCIIVRPNFNHMMSLIGPAGGSGP